MRRLLGQLLNLLGLVRIGHLTAVQRQLRDAEGRFKTVKQERDQLRAESEQLKVRSADQVKGEVGRFKAKLEEARTDMERWKSAAGEAQRALKAAKAQGDKHAERANRLQAQRERDNEQGERRSREFDSLAKRLELAERQLIVAREHLMAVEVKLDILEGAANVLDARTRTVIGSQERAESGAPV